MKKIIFVLIVGFLLLATIACCFSYKLGFNSGINKATKTENNIDFESNNVFGKIDYPLIEINFSPGNEWLVIDREALFTEKEIFRIIQNSQYLQLNSESLQVITFPVGRGTTPNGIIYVYKDGILIKEVPYIEAYFESDVLKNAFQQVTKEKVQEIIKSELPPAI